MGAGILQTGRGIESQPVRSGRSPVGRATLYVWWYMPDAGVISSRAYLGRKQRIKRVDKVQGRN